MKSENMYKVPAAERSSQMWLNIDDVLGYVPVSRAQLYKMIDDGKFPKPHLWRGTPLWTQSAVRTWINDCASGTSQPAAEKTPATWSAIEAYLKEQSPRGFTNKQIAFFLDADEGDVSALTRIMTKAKVLCLFKPLRDGSGSPNFYTFNTGDVEFPA